jgi:hypothetical protein
MLLFGTMTDATALPLQRPRRFRFDWIIPVLFRPRAALAQITAELEGVWLTPLVLLTLSGLLAVAAAGPIRTAAAQSGGVELPPEAQFWTPEQQAAYFTAQQQASGPVFVYVFPALLTVLGVWFGWLVAAGLLHLVLTLLGGRVTSGSTLNLAAWAALPFVLRDLVQAGFMLVSKQLVQGAGLAGFAPAGTGLLHTVLVEVLKQIDLYGLWYALLLIIGVRIASGLRGGKAITAVVLTLAVLLLLMVLPAVIAAQLGSLDTLTPFLGF